MTHFLTKAMRLFSKGRVTNLVESPSGSMDTPQQNVSPTTVGTTSKADQMQNSTKLSKNFTLGELTYSETAERLGIDNTPDAEQVSNLKVLTTELLQPIRDRIKRPIVISSGFRSLKLNRKLKSEDNSQHLAGQAADIKALGLTNYQLAKYIVDSGLDFDQLILEFYTGPGTGWVHLSRKRGKNRREVLTINKSGVTLGLVDHG